MCVLNVHVCIHVFCATAESERLAEEAMSGDPDGAAVWVAVSAENLSSDSAVRYHRAGDQ